MMHTADVSGCLRASIILLILGCCRSPSQEALAQGQPNASKELSKVAATRLQESYTAGETEIAASPDGALVAVGRSLVPDGQVDVWDAVLGKKLYSLPLAWGVGSRFSFSHDGKTLAAVTQYSTVTIHDARSGARRLRIDINGSVDCVVFTANDASLLTGHSSGYRSTAVQWSVSDGKQLRGFPDSLQPPISYPDPKTASPQEVLRALSEIASASTRGPQRAAFMHALAIHPDGERMSTLGEDGSGTEVPKIWSLSRGSLIKTLEVGGQRVTRIAFSPDGKYLAGGTLENTILLWETATWSIVRRIGQSMPPTQNRVTGITLFHETTALAFSPDSRRLVSGHSGGPAIIRFWNLATGDELDSYTSPMSYGTKALAFASGGDVVLASGAEFVLAFFVKDGFLEPYPIVGFTRRELAERAKAAQSLISAVQRKDLEGVRGLLAAGTDPNHPGNDGTTALLEAVRTGEISLVAALVDSGADVNGRDLALDFTAVWLAASTDETEIAALLCKHGADVNAVGPFGSRALHWAASNGQLETVKLLLGCRADVNARDETGATALSRARANGYEEVVRELVAAGANGR
ncbi:MAG: ankyrin repeat domain-containing protein [Vicinamibacterales bacterium]